jgi:hypothetical protein
MAAGIIINATMGDAPSGGILVGRALLAAASALKIL